MTAGADYTYSVIHKVCVEHIFNVIKFGLRCRKSPVNLLKDWLKLLVYLTTLQLKPLYISAFELYFSQLSSLFFTN